MTKKIIKNSTKMIQADIRQIIWVTITPNRKKKCFLTNIIKKEVVQKIPITNNQETIIKWKLIEQKVE